MATGSCSARPGVATAGSLRATTSRSCSHRKDPNATRLAPDIRAAFDADLDAGAFFESLAQFYRNAYLRWIDGTKRRPEVRSARIAEMIELLKAGEKQRPGT